ncbi:hypothetical protein K474DRAFT_183473 [Panus rudis PR-1116 ss-1]|nr:hypothetical protein K474DRAFT_183473 [Panus rudis PR-1116 ss-1]
MHLCMCLLRSLVVEKPWRNLRARNMKCSYFHVILLRHPRFRKVGTMLKVTRRPRNAQWMWTVGITTFSIRCQVVPSIIRRSQRFAYAVENPRGQSEPFYFRRPMPLWSCIDRSARKVLECCDCTGLRLSGLKEMSMTNADSRAAYTY